MLPESSSMHRHGNPSLPYVNDPYIIDIVKVTEDRVAELEVQLQEQKRYADEMETKMTNLKYQVSCEFDVSLEEFRSTSKSFFIESKRSGMRRELFALKCFTIVLIRSTNIRRSSICSLIIFKVV